MSSDKAEKLKSQGNEFFTKGKYTEAIRCYNEAIQCDPSNAILYSNRAFAYIKLDEAEKDCVKAIELNNSFDKAYFRRGLARKQLKRYNSSMKDFQKALSISPSNVDIKKEIESLRKILQSEKLIRLYPVVKDEELRSKLPLREIPIVITENLIIEEDAEIKLQDHVRQLIQDQKPKNFVEFDRCWREFKDWNLKLEYLESISLFNYEKIFEYPFEPKLLFDVLDVLSHSENYFHVYQILEKMTKMPRFDLNFSFLSKQEYQVMKSLFTKLLKGPIQSNVLALAQKFNVNKI